MIKYHVYLGNQWTATYDGSLKDAELLANQAAFLIGGSVKKEVTDSLDKDEIPM